MVVRVRRRPNLSYTTMVTRASSCQLTCNYSLGNWWSNFSRVIYGTEYILDWVTDWLLACLLVYLIDRPTDWPLLRLAFSLARLIVCSIDWLIDWLIDWYFHPLPIFSCKGRSHGERGVGSGRVGGGWVLTCHGQFPGFASTPPITRDIGDTPHPPENERVRH